MALPGWLEFVISHPDLFGWAGTLLYLIYEIRGPRGRINELMGLLKNTVVVVRGLARVHSNVDTESVDDYLVENGMEPSDFIEDDPESEVIQKGDD